jgi:hypothetical protein
MTAKIVRWHTVSCACPDCLDSDRVASHWWRLDKALFGENPARRSQEAFALLMNIKVAEEMEAQYRRRGAMGNDR